MTYTGTTSHIHFGAAICVGNSPFANILYCGKIRVSEHRPTNTRPVSLLPCLFHKSTVSFFEDSSKSLQQFNTIWDSHALRSWCQGATVRFNKLFFPAM